MPCAAFCLSFLIPILSLSFSAPPPPQASRRPMHRSSGHRTGALISSSKGLLLQSRRKQKCRAASHVISCGRGYGVEGGHMHECISACGGQRSISRCSFSLFASRQSLSKKPWLSWNHSASQAGLELRDFPLALPLTPGCWD